MQFFHEFLNISGVRLVTDFYLPAFVEIGKIKVTNDNINTNIF